MPTCLHRERAAHLGAAVALAVLVAPVLLGGSSAAQEPVGDPRSRRAEVREERAEAAAQVDALTADQAEVTAALATIEDNVQGQQALAADAQRAADAARGEAERQARAAEEAQAEIERLRQAVAQFAVESYVNPPTDQLLRRFDARSAQADATRRALLDLRSGHDADVLEQLRVAQRTYEDREADAANAAADAERQARDAQDAVASLDQARADQAAYADQVRQRLDARLAEVAALEQVDAELAARILAEEAAVAAAVANAPTTTSPPPSTAPSPAPTSGGSGGGGSGGGSGGTVPPTTRAPSPTAPPTTSPPTTSRPPVTVPGAPSLRTVGGITVAASIADRLRGLLDAAAADGITLGGYGYRDSSSQIALRRQNCGTSNYAVYEMPPDQCSPPTARPGASMHERGLAIDFTYNGSFISTRSSAGFIWLAANAGRFGFANLPSEPWHWSTTGG